MAFEGSNAPQLNVKLGAYENMLKNQYDKNDFASAFRFKGGGILSTIKTDSQKSGGKNLTMDQELSGAFATSSDPVVAQELSKIQAANETTNALWIANNAAYHVFHRIELEDLLRANDTTKSFLMRRQHNVTAKMNSFWQKVASVNMWGPGRGAVGVVNASGANTTRKLQIGSNSAGAATTITSTHRVQVQSPEQTRCIVAGSTLEFYKPGANFPVNDVGGIVGVGQAGDGYTNTKFANSAIVVAVEHHYGTGSKAPWIYIKATTAVGGANDLANGDIIYFTGDKGKRYWASIPEWVPVKAPSGMFMGMDRGYDPVRLGGFRRSLSNDESIVEAIDTMYTEITLYGDQSKRPTEVCMNHMLQRALTHEVGQGVGDTIASLNPDTKTGGGRTLNRGYKQLIINTGQGELPIKLDANAPLQQCYLLHKPSMRVKYLGPKLMFPVPGTKGGDYVYLVNDVDGGHRYENRWACYANLLIGAVGKCGVIDTKNKTGFWQT